jgi:hypothetical protein
MEDQMAHAQMSAPAAYTERVTVSTGWQRVINWHGVVAGMLVALSLHILLSLLGMSIGAALNDADAYMRLGNDESMVAAIWWACAGIISAFAGGLVAGRFSSHAGGAGAFHGLLSWALGILIVLGVMGSVAGLTLNEAMSGLHLQPATPELPAPTPEQLAAIALYGFLSLLAGAILATLGGYLGSGPLSEEA